MKNGRCVIVGGAIISDYEIVRSHFRLNDFFVFCDGGLYHEKALGVSADLIVGDFDSHPNPQRDVETIILPREKDDTDTVFAAKECLRRGFDDFLLVGVVGGRLDHTIANLGILLFLDNNGKKALLVDDYSQMEVVGNSPLFVENDFAYFSLMNVFGEMGKINIENSKFPLKDGEIRADYQYAVSNEVLPGKITKIIVGKGKGLLIKILRNKIQ